VKLGALLAHLKVFVALPILALRRGSRLTGKEKEMWRRQKRSESEERKCVKVKTKRKSLLTVCL